MRVDFFFLLGGGSYPLLTNVNYAIFIVETLFFYRMRRMLAQYGQTPVSTGAHSLHRKIKLKISFKTK